MRRPNSKLPQTKSEPSSPIAEPLASVMSHPWPWLAVDWRQRVVYDVFDGVFSQKDPTNHPTKSENAMGVAGQRFILNPGQYILARLTRFRKR